MASNADKEDEELTIPRAAMNKLIKELVPDIRVANDTRELILQCGKEFIRVITTHANAICEEQQKKTMSAEHVLSALQKLGFSSYKSEAELVLNDCKGGWRVFIEESSLKVQCRRCRKVSGMSEDLKI